MEKTYSVYKVSIDTMEAVDRLGFGMSNGQSYICERNADRHIDPLKYFIIKVETGSAKDLELLNNLKANLKK